MLQVYGCANRWMQFLHITGLPVRWIQLSKEAIIVQRATFRTQIDLEITFTQWVPEGRMNSSSGGFRNRWDGLQMRTYTSTPPA